MQRHDRHQEAVRCLGEAVLRDPTDRYAYQALERSLRFTGKKDEADLAASRVQKLTETSQLARQFGFLKRGTKQEMNRIKRISCWNWDVHGSPLHGEKQLRSTMQQLNQKSSRLH